MFESLGQYKILERIGAGGMGDVYRARDTRLGRTVAIKVLSTEVSGDPDRCERFMRDARAAAALSHPNIAALYEVGEDQGDRFLAFEFVPGETLRAVIAGRPLNPRRAIDLAIQVADALAEAHAAGIVHRDIKPDNIIVTPKGSAKILDFGLATWTAGGAERMHGADAATSIVTNAGTTLGTVMYMSPEQALGHRVDHRTDIFSLGIVLFEMLTGKLPFTGATTTAVARQLVQTPAPKPSSANRDLPTDVDDIVLKALAKDPDERYESAATMAGDLRALAGILDARVARGDRMDRAGPAKRTAIPSSRPQTPWRPVVAALFAAGALAAAGWSGRGPIERAWRRAIGPAPAPIIAVVPFETGPDQTFFADGLADDLITRLGQTPGLKVIGRSTTRSDRGHSPRDVAREFGAGVVLTGSVQPLGQAVKVSLELIDPVNGTDIWSDEFTRDVKDIFAVQADVADHVAQALRVTLQPTAARARAASRLVDPRAYETYLRGRDAAANRQSAQAIAFFQRAIDIDAGLAEAHAGLAEALFRQGRSSQNVAAVAPRMQAEIEAAFRADPDSPQAHYAAALLESRRVGVAKGLEHLRAAISADPSYADAYRAVGDLVQLLLPDRAIAYYEISLTLDPHLDASRGDIVRSLLLMRRRTAAAAEAATMAADPLGSRVMLAEYDLLDSGRDTLPLGVRPAPGALVDAWVRYGRALKQAGRDRQAQDIWRSVIAVAPAACEAEALLGRRSTVAATVDPLSPAIRCGIVAAASKADPAGTAGLIDRLAQHPDTEMDDVSVTADLANFSRARTWYPWTRVVGDLRVQRAVGRLNEALARVRGELPSMLPPLPGR